ncbi:MAG: hypothetical protein QF489_10535 [Planctomycetota bacterium]|jgi:hypothetical protein|nr:hypothetical protein [Planctomycetota bacterium]
MAAVLVACSDSGDPAKAAGDQGLAATNGFLDTDSNAGGKSKVLEGDGPKFGDADLAGDGLLWETPDLPEGIALEIAGKPVDHFVTEAYLMGLWSTFASSRPLETPVEELTNEFFADPEALFYDLVRGVLLLREAESRFAEYDKHAFEDYKERMEGAAGTVRDSLIARYGEDGWNAHVERRFRLQLLLDDFQQYAAEVTEEELFAFYDSEILAQLPDPEKREHVDVSFTAMEPTIRANLMKGRAVEAQEKWLDDQLEDVAVVATLPAGLLHSWTLSGPR